MFVKNMTYEDTSAEDVEMIILTGSIIIHEEDGRNNYKLLDNLFNEVRDDKFTVLAMDLGNVVDLYLLRSKVNNKVYHVCFCEKYFKSVLVDESDVDTYIKVLKLENALLSCEVCENLLKYFEIYRSE